MTATAVLGATGRRLRDGGTWPIVGALALIWLVLQAFNQNFLSADNLVNLAQQSVGAGLLTLGIVLVLMIGQIDLSIGAVSGLGSAVVAVGFMQVGMPLAPAVACALGTGAVIGLGYGLLLTRLDLPSFVVTLAGLLVVLGVQLWVLGRTGTVNLPFESWLVRFSQQMFLPAWASYLLAGVVVGAYGASLLLERRRRSAAALPVAAWTSAAWRVAALAVVLAAATVHLNTNRGIGYTFVLFVGLVALADVALRRTRWGLAVRAIGGDVGSARRVGLPVRRVTVSVFVLCSTLAALGGVLAAGRLAAANQGTGGAEVSLTAIAAAVIGGVSLFGGRGTAWSALVGILVIQSLSSGLTLMNLDASVRYVITGIVLVGAVTIDSLARRAPARRTQPGRLSGR